MWENIAQKQIILNINKNRCSMRIDTRPYWKDVIKRITIRNQVLFVKRFNSTMKFVKSPQ